LAAVSNFVPEDTASSPTISPIALFSSFSIDTGINLPSFSLIFFTKLQYCIVSIADSIVA